MLELEKIDDPTSANCTTAGKHSVPAVIMTLSMMPTANYWLFGSFTCFMPATLLSKLDAGHFKTCTVHIKL